MKNVWPTDWRYIGGIILSCIATIAIGYFLWQWIPELLKWFIEILGYPFWVVFTKFLKIEINQFEAFWAFFGIACIAMVIVGNFTPVRVSQQVTVTKNKEETEGWISPLRGWFTSASSFIIKIIPYLKGLFRLLTNGATSRARTCDLLLRREAL